MKKNVSKGLQKKLSPKKIWRLAKSKKYQKRAGFNV